jgi:lipopolysaccharide/colanic/teichoic acid biosynthesis glycosyltransferase
MTTVLRRDVASRNGSRGLRFVDDAESDSARSTTEPYLRKKQRRITTPVSKRILDFGVILLTAPLWLPVLFVMILWVKATSPGPALFRQRRIGFGGRQFFIFKLRTMKVDAETHVHESYFEQMMRANRPMTKLDATGDPRLIFGGALLRAAGLDELPQVFNVLRGEMSLIGPRPCTPNEFQRYTKSQRRRIFALPGLTGYWQVNGKNRTTFRQMIAMDVVYIRKWSLWLDLGIILKTGPVLCGQVLDSYRRWRVRARRAAAESKISLNGQTPSNKHDE